ncbi:MAG: prephenate dehydrogenase/arogenate dehydrogenase family protein [Actinobacteria bacterium]|nr:prephenate dehydrogenase/arogenate dehydrogenase family protein [Actinomycetota bacterium]
MSTRSDPRATIVGTGLIGASIGAGLRARGWHISGVDIASGTVARAIELGACDREGFDPDSDIVFVATPADAVVTEVGRSLEACRGGIVTDVAGVKEAIVTAITDPRFVGGHPMAGSEELGVEGADPDLFEGAAWVLCPGPTSDDASYAVVRRAVASLGAAVLTLDPADHDRLVAVVSHVPHLTAAALMRVADAHADDHAALLRLAAGGFRDMTRIAAGSPNIWPALFARNRDAIVTVIDQLRDELGALRDRVADADGAEVLRMLTEAQRARRNLPTRPSETGPFSEVRVLIRDRPGSIKDVAALATDLDVNLASATTIDLDGATGGMLLLRVLSTDAAHLRDGLVAAGFRAFVQSESDP